MSLADTLLGGFSDSEPELESNIDSDIDVDGTLENDINHSRNVTELLTITDLDSIDSIYNFCPILPKVTSLSQKLDEFDSEDSLNNGLLSSDEQVILAETNKFIIEINHYFNILNSFIKISYQNVWPDLENLIKNPLFFIKVIEIIKFDISTFREHVNNDKFNFLTKDQILSLTMSSNFLVKAGKSIVTNIHTQQLILETCDIQLQMNEMQLKFRNFITQRATRIAPNITALVGPSVSAQLIASIGLQTICSTPACNIPSVGKSTSTSLGYIYQADIVKNIPDDFKRQAVRQISSKIVMAARIDYSYRGKNTDNSLGKKWNNEIKIRLEKLMSPPDNVNIKPLAKPVDMKSKRRGGRKFKKMRERMKMSEVEKAQNKMIFGERENTRTDAFGEEVGLGMLGKSTLRNVDNIRGVHVTKGTKQKIEEFTKEKSENNEQGSKLLDLL